MYPKWLFAYIYMSVSSQGFPGSCLKPHKRRAKGEFIKFYKLPEITIPVKNIDSTSMQRTVHQRCKVSACYWVRATWQKTYKLTNKNKNMLLLFSFLIHFWKKWFFLFILFCKEMSDRNEFFFCDIWIYFDEDCFYLYMWKL